MTALRGLTIVLLALILASCGGSPKLPFKTLARPPLGQLHAPPNCASLPDGQHFMGACLPRPSKPVAPPRFLQAVAITGPDLSNNDPVYSASSWRAIAQRNKFVYLKSVEGTGYYDRTAQAMAAAAKAAGLPAGGYDFVHLCQVDPAAEAHFFVVSLRAQGLLGAGTLPPAGDVEYGSSSCDTRAWILAWIQVVTSESGRTPIIYTGAWFWNPYLGSFWPAGILGWISGYGVRYPYMPSGLSHLDLWQSSDRGFNGASYADLSSWMHDAASFAKFAGLAPPRPHCFGPLRQLDNPTCTKLRPLLASWSRARDSSLRALNARHCLYSGIVSGTAAPLFHRRVDCDALRQRASYFAQQVNANLY